MNHDPIRSRALVFAAAVAALAAAAPAVAADDMLYNSTRFGLYSVFYHVTASDLSGAYVPAGANIDAKNVQTLYLAYVRSIDQHFQVEVTAGYPPLQKTVGKGPATAGSVPYDGQVIATARWLAPTVLLEYSFFSPKAKLRPFIGAGVNYTQFYDRDSTAQGNAASGGPTKLSLSASVGPAGTAGLDYNIGANWHAYASYSISRVRTNLQADTAGVTRTTRINFGPQAMVLSVGYSF